MHFKISLLFFVGLFCDSMESGHSRLPGYIRHHSRSHPTRLSLRHQRPHNIYSWFLTQTRLQWHHPPEEYLPEVQQESNDNVAGPSSANNGPKPLSPKSTHNLPSLLLPPPQPFDHPLPLPPALGHPNLSTPTYQSDLSPLPTSVNPHNLPLQHLHPLHNPHHNPYHNLHPPSNPHQQPDASPPLHPAVTAGTPAARKHVHLPLI
ncbi:hypothetical protein M422DRAFT_245767 [Sphaerobolus stellatus SS14]|nr:hypothetical protein M422DRAFT_245767 [Sphaerobolus stellatus SS14]